MDIRDAGMGATTDQRIMDYALECGRIIVTRDTDFGQVLRYPNHPGAIILRLPNTFRSDDICARLDRFLKAADQSRLIGAITVVELHGVRRRPLA